MYRIVAGTFPHNKCIAYSIISLPLYICSPSSLLLSHLLISEFADIFFPFSIPVICIANFRVWNLMCGCMLQLFNIF